MEKRPSGIPGVKIFTSPQSTSSPGLPLSHTTCPISCLVPYNEEVGIDQIVTLCAAGTPGCGDGTAEMDLSLQSLQFSLKSGKGKQNDMAQASRPMTKPGLHHPSTQEPRIPEFVSFHINKMCALGVPHQGWL